MPTVLVVDDLISDRLQAGGLLEKIEDVSVIYASNGREALEQMESQLPSLVLTDLQMPEMDGLQLVTAIKQKYPQVPVILMTAKGSDEIAVKALELGAASYVPKNLLAEDLQETVGRVLATAQEERGITRLMKHIEGTETTYVLENDLGLISSLVSHLRQTAQHMDLFDESQYMRISTALDEALLNAYYHGNLEVSSKLAEEDHSKYYELAKQRSQQPPYNERRIHVHVRFAKNFASYTIRDHGPGFQPAEIPDPTDPEFLERPCGRGVLLMRTFMDEVSFNDTGNEVTMLKRRESAAT